MPLTPPVLDDLDYATVFEALRSRIPIVAPEWTDHNDSDPGITLLQLFAHLAEMVGYRLNRVPEKNYVEFLKLVGVRLAPAMAARTRMVFTLTRPERCVGLLLPAGTRISAKGGSGKPPVFETDRALDLLPAQLAALISTRHDLLDINGAGDSGPGSSGAPKAYIDERFAIVWDGKTPKLKDMPTQPVPLFAKPNERTHRTLYLALAFNQSAAAGFKGARAALHLQLDDDEQPDDDASVQAGAAPLSLHNIVAAGAALVDYHYYRPPATGDSAGSWQPLLVLADETEGWTRSGSLRFEVPLKIGPVPAGSWVDVAAGVPHPLPGALKTPVDDTPAEVPVSGWLRVRFAVPPQVSLRSLSFNTTIASHLQTVRNERLGEGNGRSDQTLALANGNLAAGTLVLVSREPAQPEAWLAWRERPDFDSAGPDDRVYVVDAEAGSVIFGDGERGRAPRAGERLVAQVYRHGGGALGDVATGAVSQPAGLPSTVSGAFNLTPARGGRDAQTLDDAKKRAPRAFAQRGRAVTADDFADAACAAPGARIARATVVPLHRPYPPGQLIAGERASGVDMDSEAPGVLTVVVVPAVDGAYPVPTAGALAAVAAHLDGLRLLTTEVHVSTPQYLRLYDLQLVVRAAAGYTVTALREAIADALRRRFHALSGGADGDGYAFGASLHHADLVAAVFGVAGVARVESLSCWADGQSPAGDEPAMLWRHERRVPVRLTNCPDPDSADDVLHVVLFPDELPFVDAMSLSVSVVGSP